MVGYRSDEKMAERNEEGETCPCLRHGVCLRGLNLAAGIADTLLAGELKILEMQQIVRELAEVMKPKNLEVLCKSNMRGHQQGELFWTTRIEGRNTSAAVQHLERLRDLRISGRNYSMRNGE